MKICVFCGSSSGRGEQYRDVAQKLGQVMAGQDISLVYGGAKVGLMGEIANAVMEAGGKAIGVMPQSLVDVEIAHSNLTELHVVGSMHERKAKMAELSDGFVALPGGIGTLEELFEIWTWTMLGFHQKPVAVLNIDGFYDKLQSFLDHLVAEQFVKKQQRQILINDCDPATLIQRMKDYQPTFVTKWIEK